MTDNKIETRQLGQSDFDDFRSLMMAFYAYANEPHAGLESIKSLFQKATDQSSNLHFLIAVHEEKMVGIISLTIGESSYKNSPFAFADDFFVVPEKRGTGIGKALIDHAMRIATDKKCSNILVGVGNDETDTLRFYTRAGFKDMKCKLLTLPLSNDPS